jgi:hypothetical protein
MQVTYVQNALMINDSEVHLFRKKFSCSTKEKRRSLNIKRLSRSLGEEKIVKIEWGEFCRFTHAVIAMNKEFINKRNSVV